MNVAESYTRYSIWCSMNGERRTLPKRFFEEDIGNRYRVLTHGGNRYFEGLMYSTQFHNKINNGAPAPSANLTSIPSDLGMVGF